MTGEGMDSRYWIPDYVIQGQVSKCVDARCASVFASKYLRAYKAPHSLINYQSSLIIYLPSSTVPAFSPCASLAQGVQMTGCPQIYFVFGNRRSGKNLFPEIVPRQNLQFVIDLDDRHDASHGGSDDLLARNNG